MMAVGLHAVLQAGLAAGTPAVVIGCGPVGLAVIAALKLTGHGPIVAADFSPKRRKMAETMGADIVIDPAQESPHQYWESFGVAPTLVHESAWSLTGRISRPSVVFECVGVPGLIQSLIDGSPPNTQIVVVGACLAPDTFEPGIALSKQMTIRFVRAYSPEEFSTALTHIANGDVDVAPMITGSVGLNGVADAFERLRTPGHDVKIIVKAN
jgi:threonine dehydrogenase-like Zn-dependent dehydrogenase